jgi:3-methyl-2-oxobutanoate hydroxymethyltransferase
MIIQALTSYVTDVKLRQFPEASHMFTMKEEALTALYGGKEQ